MTTALEGVRGQRHAPAALYPGKDQVPIVQEAGWALGPVWTGAENLAPPGFDPRAAQPVASRYIDDATRPTFYSEEWSFSCTAISSWSLQKNYNSSSLRCELNYNI